MSFTFKTEFTPGQEVRIKPLDIAARVEMVRIDQGEMVDYYVAWWNDGKRNQEWMPGSELSA